MIWDITSTLPIFHFQPLPKSRLCLWLTVLEYVEVFLELSAESVGGEAGRWVVIACVQIAKYGYD